MDPIVHDSECFSIVTIKFEIILHLFFSCLVLNFHLISYIICNSESSHALRVIVVADGRVIPTGDFGGNS